MSNSLHISAKQRYLNFLDAFIEKHHQYLNEKVKERHSELSEKLSNELSDTFYEQFIDIPGLTFDLNKHVPEIDKKTFKKVTSNVKLRQYSKKSFMLEMKYKVQFEMNHRFLDKSNFCSSLFLNENVLHNIFTSKHCSRCDQIIYASLDYTSNTIIIPEYMNQHMKYKTCIEKIDKYTSSILTPSQAIVLFNNPYPLVKIERENKYETSINSPLGCKEESELYEKHNIGFFMVSDSSPAIFQKKNELVVGNYVEDYEDQEYFALIDKGFEEIGYVPTDLHWYTLMDSDMFEELCQKNNIDKKDIHHVYIDTGKNKCEIVHYIKNVIEESDQLYSAITFKN